MIARLRTEEILDEVRRERMRLVRDTPEPVVINLDAVLTIGQSREVRWGAITLHAPPLSFPLGARLLICANALRDLQQKQAPPASIRAAHLYLAAHLRQALKPGKPPKPGRPHLPRPYFGCWSCLFTKDEPETVEGLARWLIDPPDQATYDLPTRKVTVDFMDTVAQFARAFPAWMGADGWPLSWAHYQYGIRHLGRSWVREELRTSAAVRMGMSEKKDYQTYSAEQRRAAGWH